MAINVSVQYKCGFLPGIILLDPMLLPSENRFKYHQEVLLYLQPMIPPKRFDTFPPDWGMLRRSRCEQIVLETTRALQLQRMNCLRPSLEATEGIAVYCWKKHLPSTR